MKREQMPTTLHRSIRLTFIVLIGTVMMQVPVRGEELSSPSTAKGIPCFGFTGRIPIRIEAGTEIRYVVPGNGSTVLSILDIVGHTLVRLVEGVDLTGAQTVRWSGRDKAGNLLSNGVYFIRLEAGGYTDIQKVVVIQ